MDFSGSGVEVALVDGLIGQAGPITLERKMGTTDFADNADFQCCPTKASLPLRVNLSVVVSPSLSAPSVKSAVANSDFQDQSPLSRVVRMVCGRSVAPPGPLGGTANPAGWGCARDLQRTPWWPPQIRPLLHGASATPSVRLVLRFHRKFVRDRGRLFRARLVGVGQSCRCHRARLVGAGQSGQMPPGSSGWGWPELPMPLGSSRWGWSELPMPPGSCSLGLARAADAAGLVSLGLAGAADATGLVWLGLAGAADATGLAWLGGGGAANATGLAWLGLARVSRSNGIKGQWK